jgi:Lipopolysaccharide-assembly
MIRFLALTSCFALFSCTGYQLQSDRPQALANVKSINVPLFANKTLIPRGETLATNSVIDAIAIDGTYRIVSDHKADAILRGTIESISYRQVRSTRLDTLRSEDMENTFVISWELCDARNPMKILARGKAKGSSRFAIDSNLQTARTNAMPDAMQRAATQIVGRLTDDF